MSPPETLSGPLQETGPDYRYFLSYSGVRLVSPIEAEALSNRNTFIRAAFDPAGLLLAFEKVVYGEVEMSHRYGYDQDGVLRRAEILMLDEDPVVLHFDGAGAQVAQAQGT
jgi:Family of unknown function (DUF6156)